MYCEQHGVQLLLMQTARNLMWRCLFSQHVRANANGHSLLSGCTALDLLSQLLTYDPEHRCTAQQALRHRYFSEVCHWLAGCQHVIP